MTTVDREEIFRDTYNAFAGNEIQKEAVSKLDSKVGTVPEKAYKALYTACLLYTSPSPRDS